MVCSKCKEELSNPSEVVRCADCSAEYHPGCCRIRTECKKDSSSVGNKSDSEESSVMNKTIQKQIAEDNKLFKMSFNSLEQSMTKVQDSLALVMTRLAAVEDENVKLREECDGMRKENAAMHTRLQNAEWSVADLEQYSRMDNIEVRGVP
ncbi:hypothetical protein J6590_082830, partial [Homalodisca vitripennis]